MITTTASQPSLRLEFAELAEAARIDRSCLLGDREVVRYIEIPTVEEARRLCSRASDAQRAERGRTFFQPAIAKRARLGQGLHDRGEAGAFADIPRPAEDQFGYDAHLPLHCKIVCVENKVVPDGEEWDVSVRGDIWGFDGMEELYVFVNVGTLVLGRDASVVVRGNVFAMVCQSVSAGDRAAIRIEPTPFPVDYRSGPVCGLDGAPGAPGVEGRCGAPVVASGSILGPVLLADAPAGQQHGRDGAHGQDGSNGGNGRNGGMCKIAELTFRNVDGLLTVYSRAGRGGDGGAGGSGGAGGAGGAGASGGRTLHGEIAGGNGGRGGNGGNGGRGGHGGNGGIASNIYVNVPPEQQHLIRCVALDSEPGNGGAAGRGGAAGGGGASGPGGVPGEEGIVGRDGSAGVRGRSRPAPAIFVNERVQTESVERKELQFVVK